MWTATPRCSNCESNHLPNFLRFTKDLRRIYEGFTKVFTIYEGFFAKGNFKHSKNFSRGFVSTQILSLMAQLSCNCKKPNHKDANCIKSWDCYFLSELNLK